MHFKNHLYTYLFYDYETFGKHTALDKPAQFACIRTDMRFNIINEPQCFYCMPSDDYLPDPCSVLITYITPQYTHKYGMNEYNFSKKIYDILTIPNTCIIGYNNVHFDDEITRNIFYRNFFDSYEWSWKNGNSRWDLLNLLRACYAFRPESIKWPKNQFGLTSFKLSDITKSNNIIHQNAHDAMSDVYATVEIAKLIKKKEPKLFDFFFKIRTKYELKKLINLKIFKPMVHVASYLSAKRYHLSIILPIKFFNQNNNILISIDLLKDVKAIINFLKKNHMHNNIFIKDLFDLGVILLYLNRCPILAPIQTIRKEDYYRLGFSMSICNENINLIKKNYFFIQNIEKYFFEYANIKKYSNVDLQIYDSFFDIHDKKIIKLIRDTKSTFLNHSNYDFHDVRLRHLLFRYRARNFFNTLDVYEKKLWLKHCIDILNPEFLKKYHNKILMLLQENSNDFKKVMLLKQLLNYVFQKNNILLYQRTNLN